MRKTLVAALFAMAAAGMLNILTAGDCGATASSRAISREITNVRYALSSAVDTQTTFYQAVDEMATGGSDDDSQKVKEKSPEKAFLLSLAVPGLGQLYYGSKMKPVFFAGAEAAAWLFRAHFNNSGDQMIADYEAFNQAHWSQTSYGDYLEAEYGYRDDDSIQVQEISHHLPDTKTQQYYEMTGKYSQFAWGWDDAVFHDSTLSELIAAGGPPAITSDDLAPYSARRIAYEDARGAANQEHRKADRMLAVIMLNHVVSAFEAYFTTKRRNSSTEEKRDEFGRWKITPSVKSYSAQFDTPYIKVTYKF
jgi:hypothetical protein